MKKYFKLFEWVFLIAGVLCFSKDSFGITGNVIGSIESGIFNMLGFVFIFMSLILFVTEKGLEAMVMVPTGPGLATQERLVAAINDYKSKGDNSEYLIWSGGVDKRDTLGARKAYRFARKSGLPKEVIILESKAKNTVENFVNTVREASKRKVSTLGISTDKQQYRRFQLYFDQAKKEGMIDDDFKIEFVESGPVRPNVIYGVLAYYQDKGRLLSAGSLKKASEGGKIKNPLSKAYYIARGIVGI